MVATAGHILQVIVEVMQSPALSICCILLQHKRQSEASKTVRASNGRWNQPEEVLTGKAGVTIYPPYGLDWQCAASYVHFLALKMEKLKAWIDWLLSSLLSCAHGKTNAKPVESDSVRASAMQGMLQ